MSRPIPFLVLIPLAATAQHADWTTATDTTASGGGYIAPSTSASNTDLGTPRHVSYRVQLPEPGSKRLWIRYRTTDNAPGGVYLAVEGGAFTLVNLPASSGWSWFAAVGADLTAGVRAVRLVKNTGNVQVDRFYLAPGLDVFPVGKGGNVGEFGAGVTYDAWKAGFAWGNAATDSLPTSDPDGDAIPNRLEYEWGSSPLVPGTASMWIFSSSGNLVLRFLRSKSVANPTPRLERTSDFVTWTAMTPGLVRVVAESATHETVELDVGPAPAAGAGLYLRLAY